MCVTWSQSAELNEIEGVVKRKERKKWEREKKTKLRRIGDMILRM